MTAYVSVMFSCNDYSNVYALIIIDWRLVFFISCQLHLSGPLLLLAHIFWKKLSGCSWTFCRRFIFGQGSSHYILEVIGMIEIQTPDSDRLHRLWWQTVLSESSYYVLHCSVGNLMSHCIVVAERAKTRHYIDWRNQMIVFDGGNVLKGQI